MKYFARSVILYDMKIILINLTINIKTKLFIYLYLIQVIITENDKRAKNTKCSANTTYY